MILTFKNRRILINRWIFTLKRNVEKQIIKYKTRWIVRDFEQKKNLNYYETFVSIIKFMNYKVFLIIAVVLNWKIKQMNVKIVFLYELINEKVYVKQFSKSKKDKKYVCRLNKAFYNLKQFSRMWYNILINFFQFLDFKIIETDYNIFINYEIKMIIEIYVNDLLIIEQFKKEIVKLKTTFKKRFYMKNMNLCNYWLELKIIQNHVRKILQLNQTNYLQQILKKFDMWESKQQITFMNIFIKLKKTLDNY